MPSLKSPENDPEREGLLIPSCAPNATTSETTVGEERCRHRTHLGWLGVLSQFQNSGKSQKSHCQGGLYKMAPLPCHLHLVALNSLHPHERVSNQCPWRQSHTKTASSPRTCMASSSWNTSLSDPALNFCSIDTYFICGQHFRIYGTFPHALTYLYNIHMVLLNAFFLQVELVRCTSQTRFGGPGCIGLSCPFFRISSVSYYF